MMAAPRTTRTRDKRAESGWLTVPPPASVVWQPAGRRLVCYGDMERNAFHRLAAFWPTTDVVV